MALSPDKLGQLLLGLSSSLSKTYLEAGRRWASAYSSYASDAVSPVGGSPVGLSVVEGILAGLLAMSFSTSHDPVTEAQQLATALTAFWLTPPVVFAGTPPGAVTLVAGGPALQQALVSVWAVNLASRSPADQAMRSVAQAIDGFTRTVVVTTPGGPPIVGPVT